MSKALKPKKEKVPKITEAEYARYISSLKNEDPSVATGAEMQPQQSVNEIKES